MGVAITPRKIDDYLETLHRKGCRPETVRTYHRHNLQAFYRLPESKQVGMDTLTRWCEALSKEGYKPPYHQRPHFLCQRPSGFHELTGIPASPAAYPTKRGPAGADPQRISAPAVYRQDAEKKSGPIY